MVSGKISLASDNWSGAHPSVIEAIIEANNGFAPSYGSDLWTDRALKLLQNHFKRKFKGFIIPSGTGANIFGLRLACQRHESILCSDISHIHYQESGAVESIIGCKLLTIPHTNGKITPGSIIEKIEKERAFGKHSTSPRLLSIAQPTEVGTVYTLDELAALSELCHKENLYFHMDGSRLYNAAVYLKSSLSEIIDAANVDILSLGGTKNGLMNAEALLIFNQELEDGSDYLQKQTLQLTSKMRYLSSQYIPFFQNDLWHNLASHANEKASQIASIIQSIPELSLSYPVESNQIFFRAPSDYISIIQKEIFCYLWDQKKNEIRFIASWNTSEEDIEAIKLILTKISLKDIVCSLN